MSQHQNTSDNDTPQDADYQQATIATMQDLQDIAARQRSLLSADEVRSMVDRVAQLVPAGNVPGLILSGLGRLRSSPNQTSVQRDVRMLFRGVEQVLDGAVYSAFFAGPAAVIWGYQNMLRLSGKDPDAAFPEGTWQFYVDYALREDTARHTNETHGFDTLLREHGVTLSDVDRMTAWVMTAIQTLHNYDHLLRNEWRERVYIRVLQDLDDSEAHQERYSQLYKRWLARRPYRRGADAKPRETYPAYRSRLFDQFFIDALHSLTPEQQHTWSQRVEAAKADRLPAYQQQMTLLAYLDPDQYGETRTPLPLADVHVGLIYQGRYYLIRACQPGSTTPVSYETVRAQIAALTEQPAQHPPADLLSLTQVQRAQWPELRSRLPDEAVHQLDMLRLCPILLNMDPRPQRLPLAELRQAERGIGDHALTIFDTRESFCFDQSHIFFDGAWGVALAEIMTNEALSWAWHLHRLNKPKPATERPYSPPMTLKREHYRLIENAAHVTPETSAETDAIALRRILSLRKMFKQRSDLLRLTVNDLLVLYRAIHAVTYQPDPELVSELKALQQEDWTRAAATAALDALQPLTTPPAILIPVDASKNNPRDRIHPMSFEVPLQELNLPERHRQVIAALDDYENYAGSRDAAYQRFDTAQRNYLAALAGFGAVMDRAKEIANQGESASVGTIKLLAHMSQPLQQFMDKIPGRFDVLNDIIKGREVFSNVGAVAPNSTLTRFITAKDDNNKKTLAWGVLTDAKGVMRVSLRDFRPHVGLLLKAGQAGLAMRLTDDYLLAYANGFNAYIGDLQRITRKSRETHSDKWQQ